jgi:two-component system sensor histidine kinase RegB
VSEGQRCREILRSLSQKGESEEHAPFTRMPLSTLLETVAETCRRRPGITVTNMIERLTAGSVEPQLVPTPELRHAFVNLIDNAIQFAEREVRIVVSLDPERVEVRIEDDGAGFPAEVLELLGEPYLSTRNEAGGLGLGIFIAQTLLAHTGATLQFGNRARGARVTITWSRATLEGSAPEI